MAKKKTYNTSDLLDQPETDWDKAPKKPAKDIFHVDDQVWRGVCHAIRHNRRLLLKGPSGQGKSELVTFAHKAINLDIVQAAQAKNKDVDLDTLPTRDLVSLNFGAMSDPRMALIGKTDFDPNTGTYFTPSPFLKGIQTPRTILLLDEVTRAPVKAQNILLTAMDRQGYIRADEAIPAQSITRPEREKLIQTRKEVLQNAIEEFANDFPSPEELHKHAVALADDAVITLRDEMVSGRVKDGMLVKRHRDVAITATANMGFSYVGAGNLDTAFKNRFDLIIPVGFPPADDEAAVLVRRSRISSEDAELLVAFANSQRAEWRQGDYTEHVSTRQLLAAGETRAAGAPLKTALIMSVVDSFSGEGGDNSDVARLKQLMQAEGIK